MEDQEVKGRKAAIEQEKSELASTSEHERLRVGASAGTEGRWPKGKAMGERSSGTNGRWPKGYG